MLLFPSTSLISKDPNTHSLTKHLQDISQAQSFKMGNNGTITQDQNEALQYHNQKRAEKGCQQLYWDFKLEQDALDWAQKIAGQNALQHSNHQSENIAWFSNQPENPCTNAAENWFSEEAKYAGGTLNDQGNWMDVGHFSESTPPEDRL